MDNGIRDGTTGKLFTLTCRKDVITRKDVQEALRSNHHCSRLTCRCREHEGIYLPLIPVLPQGWKDLMISREDVVQHGPGCYLFLESDASEAGRIRASSIFGPVRTYLPATPGYSDWISKVCRAQYETFASYSRRVFSRGLSDAYISKCLGLHKHTNPSTLEVFSAIDRAIRELPFTDAPDGYAGAGRMGCRLRFGLAFDKVEAAGVPSRGLDCYWWKDGLFSPGFVTVPLPAMAPAVDALRIMNNVKAPPYFVLGVQNARGACQRIFIHQVAVEEGYIFPTDSGAEGVFGVSAIKKGAALIKPVLLEDMERILAALGVELVDKAKWAYRPDFLMFWLLNGEPTLQVRELRGFKVGTILNYDRLLAEKKAYYERLKAGIVIHYEEKDGTALEWTSPTDGTEPWLNTGLPEMPAIDQ
jgi:hypothetical protein